MAILSKGPKPGNFLWRWYYSPPKCDQASNLRQQLELASQFESDLQDTVKWDRKWLVHFNVRKTQLESFNRSNNTGVSGARMNGFVLEEKIIF